MDPIGARLRLADQRLQSMARHNDWTSSTHTIPTAINMAPSPPQQQPVARPQTQTLRPSSRSSSPPPHGAPSMQRRPSQSHSTVSSSHSASIASASISPPMHTPSFVPPLTSLSTVVNFPPPPASSVSVPHSARSSQSPSAILRARPATAASMQPGSGPGSVTALSAAAPPSQASRSSRARSSVPPRPASMIASSTAAASASAARPAVPYTHMSTAERLEMLREQAREALQREERGSVSHRSGARSHSSKDHRSGGGSSKSKRKSKGGSSSDKGAGSGKSKKKQSKAARLAEAMRLEAKKGTAAPAPPPPLVRHTRRSLSPPVHQSPPKPIRRLPLSAVLSPPHRQKPLSLTGARPPTTAQLLLMHLQTEKANAELAEKMQRMLEQQESAAKVAEEQSTARKATASARALQDRPKFGQAAGTPARDAAAAAQAAKLALLQAGIQARNEVNRVKAEMQRKQEQMQKQWAAEMKSNTDAAVAAATTAAVAAAAATASKSAPSSSRLKSIPAVSPRRPQQQPASSKDLTLSPILKPVAAGAAAGDSSVLPAVSFSLDLEEFSADDRHPRDSDESELDQSRHNGYLTSDAEEIASPEAAAAAASSSAPVDATGAAVTPAVTAATPSDSTPQLGTIAEADATPSADSALVSPVGAVAADPSAPLSLAGPTVSTATLTLPSELGPHELTSVTEGSEAATSALVSPVAAAAPPAADASSVADAAPSSSDHNATLDDGVTPVAATIAPIAADAFLVPLDLKEENEAPKSKRARRKADAAAAAAAAASGASSSGKHHRRRSSVASSRSVGSSEASSPRLSRAQQAAHDAKIRMGKGARSRYGLEVMPSSSSGRPKINRRKGSISSTGSRSSSKARGATSPEGSVTGSDRKRSGGASNGGSGGKHKKSGSVGGAKVKSGSSSGKKKKLGRSGSKSKHGRDSMASSIDGSEGDHESESRPCSPPGTPPSPPTPPPQPLSDAERLALSFRHMSRSAHHSEILNDWLIDALRHWRMTLMRRLFAHWRVRYNEWRHQSFFHQWREATRTRLAQKLRLYTIVRRSFSFWVLRARYSIGLPIVASKWFARRRLELLSAAYETWREAYFARFHQALGRYADEMLVFLARKRGVRSWARWVQKRKVQRAHALAKLVKLQRKRWYIRWHQRINLRVHREYHKALALQHDWMRVLRKARAKWVAVLRSLQKDKELARLELRYAMGQGLILLRHWHRRVAKTVLLRRNFESFTAQRMAAWKRTIFQTMWMRFIAIMHRRSYEMGPLRRRAIARWARRAMHPNSRARRVLRQKSDAIIATRVHQSLHDKIEHWLYYKNLQRHFKAQTARGIEWCDSRGKLLALAGQWREWKRAIQRKILRNTGIEIHKRNRKWALYRFLMHWWRVWMSLQRKQANYEAAAEMHARTLTKRAQTAINRWWMAFERRVRAPVNLINLRRLFLEWKALRDDTATRGARGRRSLGLKKAFLGWYARFTEARGMPNKIRERKQAQQEMYRKLEAFTRGARGAFGFESAGSGGTAGSGGFAGFASFSNSSVFKGAFPGVPALGSGGVGGVSRSSSDLWGPAASSSRHPPLGATAEESFMLDDDDGTAELNASLAELNLTSTTAMAGDTLDPAESKFTFWDPTRAAAAAAAAAASAAPPDLQRQGSQSQQQQRRSGAPASSSSGSSTPNQPKLSRSTSSKPPLHRASSPLSEAADGPHPPLLSRAGSVSSTRGGDRGGDRGDVTPSLPKEPAMPSLDRAPDSERFLPAAADAEWQFDADFERGMARFERPEPVRTNNGSWVRPELLRPPQKRKDEWEELELEGGERAQRPSNAAPDGAVDWARTLDPLGSVVLDDDDSMSHAVVLDESGSQDEFDAEVLRQERLMHKERQAAKTKAMATEAAGPAVPAAQSTASAAIDAPISRSTQPPRSGPAAGTRTSPTRRSQFAPKRPIQFLSTSFGPSALEQTFSALDRTAASSLDDSAPMGEMTLDEMIAGSTGAPSPIACKSSRRARPMVTAAGTSSSARRSASSRRSRSRPAAKTRGAVARSSSIPRSFGSSPHVLRRPPVDASVQLYGSPRQMGKALVRQYNSTYPRSPHAVVAPNVKRVKSLLGFNYVAPPHLQLQHPSQRKPPLPVAALAASQSKQLAIEREEARRLAKATAALEEAESKEWQESLRDALGPAAPAEDALGPLAAAPTFAAPVVAPVARNENAQPAPSPRPFLRADRSRSRRRSLSKGPPREGAAATSRSRSRSKSRTRPQTSVSTMQRAPSSVGFTPASPPRRFSDAAAASVPRATSLAYDRARQFQPAASTFASSSRARSPSWSPIQKVRRSPQRKTRPQPLLTEHEQNRQVAQLESLFASLPSAPVTAATTATPPPFPILIPSFPVFVPPGQRAAPVATTSAAFVAPAMFSAASSAAPSSCSARSPPLDALQVAALLAQELHKQKHEVGSQRAAASTRPRK